MEDQQKKNDKASKAGSPNRQKPVRIPVHESHVTIPQVASAPPSGNLVLPVTGSSSSTTTTTTAAAAANRLSDPLSLQLPPPPPPAPRPRSNVSSLAQNRAFIPETGAPVSSSSAFALPPPPRVSPVPMQNPTEVSIGNDASNVSILPPPPPPPPSRTTGKILSSSISTHPPPPPPRPPPEQSANHSLQETSVDDRTPITQNHKRIEATTEDSTNSEIQNDSTGHDLFPNPSGPPPFVAVDTFAPRKVQILARRQTHVPVLVISTEAANQTAWKNNLQLVDLFQGIANDLRPSTSSSSSSSAPPFRSINRSIVPSNVRMQFVEPNQMEPLSFDKALDTLSDNARIQDRDGNVAQDLVLLEDRVDELLQDRNKDEALKDATKDAFQLTSPLDIPWLVRYRYALDSTTNFLPHDMVNCPPLILLVCTTNEIEAPEQVLQQLYNSPDYTLPSSFKNGLYDPQAVRHEVLVLHDTIEGPTDINLKLLRQSLQTMFGPNAGVLQINSVTHETAAILLEQEDTDLWGGQGKRGNYLSQNDRVILRRYFQTLLTTSLLPALERRIADLNAVVSERKKGMRNLVKSFWRQPKEKGGSGASNIDQLGSQSPGEAGIRYRYDSIESQTRLLADTLFLIQDYDAALSIYRLIRDDYKSDKAHSHYASCQEMMALCMYQMDSYNRSKDIFSHLETALLSYTRAAEEERSRMNKDSASARPSAAPHSTRLATRLCLLLAGPSGSSMTMGREVEVADLLASASSHESPLGAAVLLEQSSAFYYQAGMHRKYAFHMLMSGHMFRTAGQDHHAFRCFTSALYVYRHGGWHELHNHLRSALAAQLYTMQRYSVALILYAKLVGTFSGGKVSAKSQTKFLQHLIEICTVHTKSALAGADRMASPPGMSSREREAFRNSRLEKIVNVIRYNVGASRVLELPNVNLPRVVDSSIKIWTHAEQHFVDTNGSKLGNAIDVTADDPLGMPSKGVEEVWEEMELMTLAELRAVDDDRPQLDETLTAALAKISDPTHRKVIAEVDKEQQNRSLIERSKRSGGRKPTAAVRAREEPIFCDFIVQNPLSVNIELTQLQLVAKMEDSKGLTCTNEFPIEFDKESSTEQTPFLFSSTKQLPFFVPDFGRISGPDTKACQSASSAPFFVVTKENLALVAGEEKLLSVGLTPLVEGKLRIIGIRFKLSGQAWIFHPFDVPGPLLKDTRANIMNRVRGESVLLKSRIECNMPCITAEMTRRISPDAPSVASDGGPLLDGQVSDWNIRLSNVGTAPASKIVLKTNLPWICLSKSTGIQGVADGEFSATSRCLGPSATLMALPIEGAGLSSSGMIEPGEHIDIPIQIRTSGSKEQDFYMLYKYDLHDNGASTKSRSRWLRRMFTVKVYPSISLRVNTLTSSWNGRDVLVAVEITNNRTDRPTDLFVTLDRLSLISRDYNLEIVDGQFSTNDEVGNVLQIGWQERVTIHYRVCALPNESPTCLLSESELSGRKTPEVSKPCAESAATRFLCLDRSNADFESTWKAHQLELIRIENLPEHEKEHPRSVASIRRANTSAMSDDDQGDDETEPNHPTSIATLCPRHWKGSKAHLICSWRAILGQQVVHGENHIRNVPIRPLTEAHLQGNPLVTTADYPSKATISDSKPALVDMAVTVKNVLLQSTLEFYAVILPKLGFELIGPHMQRFKISPGGQITLYYKAVIPKPGVHNLQCLQLTVRQGNSECSYNLSDQWLTRVQSA